MEPTADTNNEQKYNVIKHVSDPGKIRRYNINSKEVVDKGHMLNAKDACDLIERIERKHRLITAEVVQLESRNDFPSFCYYPFPNRILSFVYYVEPVSQ